LKVEVYKLGGALFKSKQSFENLEQFLKNNPDPKIFIFSAFNKTTRQLVQAAKLAEKGNIELSDNIVEEIKQFHFSCLSGRASISLRDKLENHFGELKKILKGIKLTGELSPRTLDNVSAFGEKFAGIVLKSFFQSNKLDYEYLDAAEIIITNDDYGNAKPDIEVTQKNIRDRIEPVTHKHILMPGYYGATKSGVITTMGFESSNLTASLVAKLVNADSICIITDVGGIYRADPKLFDKPRLVEYLSYQSAYRASQLGLKLIYPDMISHLEEVYLDLKICGFDGRGTIIGPPKHDSKTPIMIVQDVTITKDIMFNENKVFKFSNEDYFSLNDSPQNENSIGLITVINLTHEQVEKTFHSGLGLKYVKYFTQSHFYKDMLMFGIVDEVKMEYAKELFEVINSF
jgi:aspartokinase/homoserine dehydrogenase 1